MTLRWNPNKDAHDGSKGDWQDLRQWHQEREQKKEQQEKKYHRTPASPQHTEEKVPEITQQDIANEQMFPTLTVVYTPNGGKGAPQQEAQSEVENGEEEEDQKTQANIDALEAEKAELLGMLSSAK